MAEFGGDTTWEELEQRLPGVLAVVNAEHMTSYKYDKGETFYVCKFCNYHLGKNRHSTTAEVSTRTSKKIMAVFTLDDGRTRTVHFGSASASDYTQHRDLVRKQQYLARHAPRENWDNPMTAGALSRWVLWNKETLDNSIVDYIQRFDIALV